MVGVDEPYQWTVQIGQSLYSPYEKSINLGF
jgi:hypothetical protein